MHATDLAYDPEPSQNVSTTARVIDHLELYGFTPADGEPDPRPLPEEDDLATLVSGLFSSITEPLTDTALEPDIADLLWSITDLLHRKVTRLERELDTNEDRQRESQSLQDGSEIRSVDLEQLIEQGRSLLERRNSFEYLRDRAGEHFEAITGSAWRPRSGSVVNHKHLTSAYIDSRDFIAAKRIVETQLHLPVGTKIAFAGGTDFNDHEAVWAVLDHIHAKRPDMVLLHGGTPRGAEKIAAAWADNRKVPQIAFKPEWTRDGKAAPFLRNDRMLETLPAAVVIFPGSGITDNLADKARKMRIRVIDRRRGGA